jgi:hypothetical protein
MKALKSLVLAIVALGLCYSPSMIAQAKQDKPVVKKEVKKEVKPVNKPVLPLKPKMEGC